MKKTSLFWHRSIRSLAALVALAGAIAIPTAGGTFALWNTDKSTALSSGKAQPLATQGILELKTNNAMTYNNKPSAASDIMPASPAVYFNNTGGYTSDVGSSGSASLSNTSLLSAFQNRPGATVSYAFSVRTAHMGSAWFTPQVNFTYSNFDGSKDAQYPRLKIVSVNDPQQCAAINSDTGLTNVGTLSGTTLKIFDNTLLSAGVRPMPKTTLTVNETTDKAYYFNYCLVFTDKSPIVEPSSSSVSAQFEYKPENGETTTASSVANFEPTATESYSTISKYTTDSQFGTAPSISYHAGTMKGGNRLKASNGTILQRSTRDSYIPVSAGTAGSNSPAFWGNKAITFKNNY